MKFNKGYKLLIFAYGFSIFSEGVLLPIYALFVENIDGNILDASGAIGVFLITSSILTFYINKQKWSEKYVLNLLVIGWLIWVLGNLGYLFVSNSTSLFVIQILLGIGSAMSEPAFHAELSDNIDSNIKVKSWGVFESLNTFLAGLAAITGGIVARFFGFNTLIILMIIISTLSLIVILRYYNQKRQKTYSINRA